MEKDVKGKRISDLVQVVLDYFDIERKINKDELVEKLTAWHEKYHPDYYKDTTSVPPDLLDTFEIEEETLSGTQKKFP